MPTPIPTGYHTSQAQLTVFGAAEAIEFYKQVFGAVEKVRVVVPHGTKILHAEIQIGDSVVMLSDEYPDFVGNAKVVRDHVSPTTVGRSTGGVYLYVPDVDATFNLAVQAGAKPEIGPTQMYWGDRYASIIDPFGHRWALATHVEDVSPSELMVRQAAYLEKLGQP
jgi:PhnB protein